MRLAKSTGREVGTQTGTRTGKQFEDAKLSSKTDEIDAASGNTAAATSLSEFFCARLT